MLGNARDVIFVIGMHRSGTSAVARVLSLCGGALPHRLMPANHANPSGYWEPQVAVDLNDLYLRARASSWSDASFTGQPDPGDRNFDDAFMSLIVDFFATGFQAAGPMILKEPRITTLLPYWIGAARRQGLAAKVIQMLRHPLDVAASLAERDGLGLDHSLALWLKYNLLGELETRGTPRTFVSYEALMRDWQAVIGRCAAELALDVTLGEDAQAAVEDFLSPHLHHHKAARADAGTAGSPLLACVLRVHRLLHRTAHGDDVDTAALDAVRARAAGLISDSAIEVV